MTLGPPWTIRKLIKWSEGFFERKGISTGRLDAELLLSHSLAMERIMLYANIDQPLQPEELTAYRALVRRRASREPIAYIVGTRGFWSLEHVKTDTRALIPRPDTETLVEVALSMVPEQAEWSVCDVGTGTGVIALSIASERLGARVIATDISADALELAQENAQRNNLEGRVEFVHGDLFSGVDDSWIPFELIVSNPPYIGEDERGALEPDVVEFEPELALFSGADGLDLMRRLVPAAHARLHEGGTFLTEIGHTQGADVSDLFEAAGFKDVTVHKDLGGRHRVVSGVH
ncbi:MAG: peptide chain release factor N(5)-glutamine methyltransferase [Myxococcota bacterium]